MLGFRAGWPARISSQPWHRSGLTLLLQVWSGNGPRALQRGAAWQRLLAAPRALLAGTAGTLPLGSPILAVPSPDARWQLSLSSPLPPSLPLPAPVSSALPRFQAPLHSKVVTNFQLQPGEPSRAENTPNLQPGPSTQLPAGPALVPFPAGTPLLLSVSLAPLQGRAAQRTSASWHLVKQHIWASLEGGARVGGAGYGVLAHPLGACRLGRPSRVRFSDPEGNVLFEHPVQKSAAPEDGMVRGAWRAGGMVPLPPPARLSGPCPTLPSPTALRHVEDRVQGQHPAAARGAAPRVPHHPGTALWRGPRAHPQAPGALRR